jgi:large subunit ribosomal protein L10
MNRDQKAAAIAEIAEQIEQSDAVFAVDYRGISVPQAAELRTKLRDADATFRVVKNSLTERAADQADAPSLKPLLEGPTALTFVRGDAAAAAKAIADYAKATDLLPFKGGLMNGDVLEPAEINAIAKLPSREVLYQQLVGVVASPITGVVRTLNALIQGLASQLGQINDKKQSGEIPAGEAPAAVEAEAPAEEAPAAEAEAPAEEAPAAEAEAPAEEAPAAEAEAPAPDAEAAPATETDEGDQDAEAPETAAASEEPAEGADDATTTDDTTEE